MLVSYMRSARRPLRRPGRQEHLDGLNKYLRCLSCWLVKPACSWADLAIILVCIKTMALYLVNTDTWSGPLPAVGRRLLPHDLVQREASHDALHHSWLVVSSWSC